ncbi:DCC1-like thiol-disulfide oxidoreductase family protein [Kitasatospora sp. NPDC002227]|uniref:thiol-disulfide oxidoreductase DCC family protein n=1 Tax=Kitasatospora sp. NPDC002227 TaxID=3154773 RepID=UPI00331BFC7C
MASDLTSDQASDQTSDLASNLTSDQASDLAEHSDGPPPVRRLTVLHDPACLLCRHLTGWLRGSAQLIPLEFVAVASAEARERFPGLDHQAALGEITVVADTGEVWRGAQAFVACLWALAEHRPLAHRLATPAGLPLARAAAFAASKYRQVTGAGRLPEVDWAGLSYPSPAPCEGACTVPGAPAV